MLRGEPFGLPDSQDPCADHGFSCDLIPVHGYRGVPVDAVVPDDVVLLIMEYSLLH